MSYECQCFASWQASATCQALKCSKTSEQIFAAFWNHICFASQPSCSGLKNPRLEDCTEYPDLTPHCHRQLHRKFQTSKQLLPRGQLAQPLMFPRRTTLGWSLLRSLVKAEFRAQKNLLKCLYFPNGTDFLADAQSVSKLLNIRMVTIMDPFPSWY